MKKQRLVPLITGILLTSITSTVVFAEAIDLDYPAANFQPKVLYTDESVEKTSAIDPDYPAANFQPKILYVDASAAQSSNNATEKKGEQSVFDPKYPAANFQPKTIYP